MGRTTFITTVALAAALTVPVAAGAKPYQEPPSSGASPAYQDLRSPDARDAAEGRTTYVVPPLVKLTPGRDGFDWGDAAIGAAGASGLLAISLAGAMTLRRRQTRPPSRVAVG